MDIPLTCSVLSAFPPKRLNVPLTGWFTLEGMLGTASPQKEKTRPMQTLAKAKDLFHNPLAQDPGYWLNVIHLLPSVQLLDRKTVTQGERESALHPYHYKRSGVMQSIAFGKKVDTPLKTTVGSSRCTQPARKVMMPSGFEGGNQRNKEPFENPEDAVSRRAMARSVMEFSYVDWNNVATSQERRLENKAAAEVCKKLTVRFR